MTGAQIAVAALAGWVIAAGVVLLLDDQTISGWIVLGLGLFAFVSLLGMIVTDRRT